MAPSVGQGDFTAIGNAAGKKGQTPESDVFAALDAVPNQTRFSITA